MTSPASSRIESTGPLLTSNPPTKDADATDKLNRDFVRAAEIGKTDTVRKLLSLGADIEFRLPPTAGIFDDQSIFPELKYMLAKQGYDIKGGEINLTD